METASVQSREAGGEIFIPIVLIPAAVYCQSIPAKKLIKTHSKKQIFCLRIAPSSHCFLQRKFPRRQNPPLQIRLLWYITPCPANRNSWGSGINLAVLTPASETAFSDRPSNFFVCFWFKSRALGGSRSLTCLVLQWFGVGCVWVWLCYLPPARRKPRNLPLTVLQNTMCHWDWWGKPCPISKGQEA